jgi:phospholipase C
MAYSQVLERFEKYLGSRPEVIFTDSDAAMAEAIAELWADTTHLLCTWHLFKNFYEHIHPSFSGKADEWHKLAGMWWKLCKSSDVSAKDTFAASWTAITDFIQASDAMRRTFSKWPA